MALVLASLAFSAGRMSYAAELPGGGWTMLFNRTNLSGWVIKCLPGDRDKSFWKVENGAIVCDSMGRKDHNYVWLMTEQEFDDFELRLKFQAFKSSPGNSGVQFRSRYEETAEGGWLDGPQVDIHPPGDMSWRTGLIYDETRGEQRWIFPSLKDWRIDEKYKPERYVFIYAREEATSSSGHELDDWNDLRLVCRGMKIVTVLNGLVRTDWDATGVLDNQAHVKRNVGRRGHFALQLHSGDELKIRFKDVWVKKFAR